MEKYDHKKIESKWQKKWEESGIYRDYGKKKKFYALDMFPYPSGAGLHVGHPKGYIATDVYSRFMMLNGCSVLHPMGWDAFGLPAENYALENKTHPRAAVEKNIAVFKKQLKKFGFTYDWDREINTTDPDYYKWTQWIFLQMFKNGLAYQSDEPINWCPKCKTGLANEDLEGGLCERCGTAVEQKKMRQWVLRMTEYADRLLYDLDKEKLDWEESILSQQKNWIGRSEGVEVDFRILNFEFRFKVYTTRVDTIFGCTYCVLAPEHKLIDELGDKIENLDEVKKYIENAKKKTELERTELQKEKTGVELKGVKAVNPFNNEEIPLFVADYVLGHYGTGAVMAVPAHDERDFKFAEKYNLPIKQVIINKKTKTSEKNSEDFGGSKGSCPRHEIRTCHSINSINNNNKFVKSKQNGAEPAEGFEPSDPEMTSSDPRHAAGISTPDSLYHKKQTADNRQEIIGMVEAFTEDGILVNSGEYSNLTSEKARKEMAKWLEEKGIGKKKVNYKMRDWVFSRQRYWGEPIPIIHCEKCGVVGVPEKDLPVRLPDVESYEPTGTGEGPLASIADWVNTKCPKCGGPGKRETNTMPQWAGSSWYYLAYLMRGISNFQFPISKYKEEFDKWLPVDLYVGGAEHATRHLLYARFWHKFLYDIGAVSTNEPFKRLVHVGLINAEDGRKMSKRWKNVINPDDIIEKFGADSIRLYEMFMGPFTQNIAWSTEGVKGVRRFLDKVWNLFESKKFVECGGSCHDVPKEIPPSLHKTIKKVTEDINNMRFNTAISQMMIFVNLVSGADIIPRAAMEKFLIVLSPFAPHMAEELWSKLGNKTSIFKEKWPEHNPAMIKDEIINLVIQVNGKARDTIEVSADINEEEAKKLAQESEKARKWVEGKKVIKVIFVKGRLVNIAVK